MSPEQKRKFNTATGIGFFVSGLVAWSMAVYFGMTPNPPKPAPVSNRAEVDMQSCVRAIQRIGFSEVSIKGSEIVAFERLGQDPKAQLERATLASLVCKLETKFFCMGESCARPGVTLISQAPTPAVSSVESTLPKPPTDARAGVTNSTP